MLLAESQNARGQRAFYDRFVPGDLPAHIRQVRKLNPRMAELYVAETGLLPLSDVSQRYRLAEQAVHLSPDNPDVLVSHSEILSFIGRYGDAIEEARRAVEIDPLSPGFRSSLIQTLAYGGQLSAAEEELRRAQQLWPGSHTIDDARFRLNSRYGDPEVALKMLQNPELRQFYMTPDMGAYVQARANPTEANIQRAIAAAASPQLPERRRVVQLAQIFSEFGRDEELYRLLSSLSPEQFRLVSGVIFRPSFKKFRQDRRFIQLAARAGLVEFWRESGKWPDFCFEPELPYDCKQEASKLK
jgi:Flp pilus assembly protein TadD